MNALNDAILAKNIEDTMKAIESVTSIIQRMIEIIQNQNDRIESLSATVYMIAPEIEVIETLADSEDEKWKMIDRYMNHNDDYV